MDDGGPPPTATSCQLRAEAHTDIAMKATAASTTMVSVEAGRDRASGPVACASMVMCWEQRPRFRCLHQLCLVWG